MGQIWLADKPIESNEFCWYDRVYEKLSIEKLKLKQEELNKKRDENYYKQREVKYWSSRFWKIDRRLDDNAAALRAIRHLLELKEEKNWIEPIIVKDYKKIWHISIYKDSIWETYVLNQKEYKYREFKISHEDMDDLVENGVFIYD